jgi:hypothetical protein
MILVLRKLFLFFYSISLAHLLPSVVLSTAGISNSLLTTGNWYRFYIENPVFINCQKVLEQLGIDFKKM